VGRRTRVPDGGPHSSVFGSRTGDTVLFLPPPPGEGPQPRQDPRVSLSVFELDNPNKSVEIRGTAELIEDTGKTLPKQLSHRYLGVDPPAESDDEIRLISA
jgi:Pyridoxamine 5'-phosphate oxidase